MNVVKCARGKVKSWKKTMGITLPEDLIERARNQSLNINWGKSESFGRMNEKKGSCIV
jgi:post-segregation antitoxin (ccd killing protein)